MSQRSQNLRALVTERLTAAAEEIFVLVERTIAEYEEELCRSKERNQQLLDNALQPQLVLHRIDAKVEWNPEPDLEPNIPETSQSKEELEEQRVKQLPLVTDVSVNGEDQPEHGAEQTDDDSVTDNDDDWDIPMKDAMVQWNPQPDLEPNIPETPQFKEEAEEQRVKRLPLVTDVGVNGEDQPEQTDNSSITDSDEDWDEPAAESDGDGLGNQIQIGNARPAALDSAPSTEDTSAAETGAVVVVRRVSKSAAGEKRKYQCDVCKKRFDTQQHLTMHTRVHTMEPPFECMVCMKAFPLIDTLKVHMRTHAVEKPYTCGVCKKGYRRKGCLKTHMRRHKEGKPFWCSVCKRGFPDQSTLSKHKLICGPGRQFKCPACELPFKNLVTLRWHECTPGTPTTTHDGGNKHTCSICGAVFSRRYYLKSHMRIHSGEKPYKCSLCGAKFTQKSTLNAHMTTHKGEKPYTCMVCPKKYTRKQKLMVHMRFHLKNGDLV